MARFLLVSRLVFVAAILVYMKKYHNSHSMTGQGKASATSTAHIMTELKTNRSSMHSLFA